MTGFGESSCIGNIIFTQKECNMLVINLWGGPGAGKSTIAAELFVSLRRAKTVNVELTNEFATELCFENAKENLKDQVYLLGNQWHRLWRLDKRAVQVAICDSPLGLGIAHLQQDKPRYYDEFVQLVLGMQHEYPTVDIFLQRDIYAEGGFKGNKPRTGSGWIHDLDARILAVMRRSCSHIVEVPYSTVAADYIFQHVLPYVAEEARKHA